MPRKIRHCFGRDLTLASVLLDMICTRARSLWWWYKPSAARLLSHRTLPAAGIGRLS